MSRVIGQLGLLSPALAPLAVIGAALVVQLVLPDEALPRFQDGASLVGLAALPIALLVIRSQFVRLRNSLASTRSGASKMEAVIQGAGDAIIVIDDQATIVTFNRAAGRMFGYTAREMVGKSLETLMTDGARRQHAAYLGEHGVTAMVEAARLRTVHRGVRKRGEVFPFELTMTEWMDGERRMFTGVLRDVSEHERTSEGLRETRARHAAIYDHFPQPVFLFEVTGDGAFALESMNRAAEEFTGRSRFANTGATPEDLAGSAEARGLRRAILECLSSGLISSAIIDLATEGGFSPLDLAFSPVRDSAGEIRCVLASGRPAALGQLASAA